jgi:hypothetical protein
MNVSTGVFSTSESNPREVLVEGGEAEREKRGKERSGASSTPSPRWQTPRSRLLLIMGRTADQATVSEKEPFDVGGSLLAQNEKRREVGDGTRLATDPTDLSQQGASRYKIDLDCSIDRLTDAGRS